MGSALLAFVGVCCFIFAAVAGIFYTADAISREREEGTLGLLFLTPLRGWDIALGKLTSCSIGVFYGLVAIQPILAVSILLGGVTAGEYTRTCLAFIITAFASLSGGLFCSTCGRSIQISTILAVVLTIACSGLFPFVGVLIEIVGTALGSTVANVQRFSDLFYLLTPARALLQASDIEYNPHVHQYWVSILYTLLLGIGALAVASRRMTWIWQEGVDLRAPSSRQRWASQVAASNTSRRILDQNPILWLVNRLKVWRWIPSTVALVLTLCVACELDAHYWPYRFVSGGEGLRVLGKAGRFVACFLFQTWIAYEAGRQLLADRRSGAIELQLATPLTNSQLARGHLKALWQSIRWPALLALLAILTVEVLPIVFPLLRGSAYEGPIDFEYLSIRVAVVSVPFVVCTWALGIASLDGALTPKYNWNATRAMILIVVLPILPWLFIQWVIATKIRPVVNEPLWLTIEKEAGFQILTVVNALFWGLKGRFRLLRHFRKFAGIPLRAGKKPVSDGTATKASLPRPHPTA